jgi:hypothetical protein
MLFFCFLFFVFPWRFTANLAQELSVWAATICQTFLRASGPTLPRPFQTSEETRVTLVSRLPDEWQQKCR